MTSTAYGLELQSRALCPLYHPSNPSQDRHCFLVGTSSYSAENKIHLLEYRDESTTLECTSVWPHREEVLGMWCSPSLSGQSLVATTSSSTLRILQVADNLVSGPREACHVKQPVSQVLWDTEGLQNEVRVTRQNQVVTISLEGGKAGTETASYAAPCSRIERAALDPHHASLCILACGTDGLQLVDYRQKRVIPVGDSCFLHGLDGVTSVDFSPSKPNEILTCGTDGLVLLHDLRITAKSYSLSPLNRLKAHEHCVQRASFNPFHDQLILTASADQTAKLWDLNGAGKPVCIKQLADFGDTVNEICWSSNGPWVFAGLSFNGKVLVDFVPSEKKMSILLEEKR